MVMGIDPVDLNPLISPALRALARLDSAEVPARVQPLVGKSGRLPKPLARSLIAELDRNPWLRDKVIEEWKDLDASDPKNATAALFLLRPKNWEKEARELAAKQARASADQEEVALEREMKKALKKIEALSAKVDRLQTELLERDEQVRARRERPDKSVPDRRRELANLAAELERERDLRRAAEEQIMTLRRRQTKKASPSVAVRRGIGGTPLQIAKQLDSQLSAFSVTPRLVPVESASSDSEPLPKLAMPGVRPDQPGAVDWLIDEAGELTLAIDGWNLAHLFKSPPSSRERDRVISLARKVGRERKLRGHSSRLVVFFDSSENPSPIPTRPREVSVSYPPSADESLIEMAGPRVVIVTSDHRVRDQSERRQAVVLWSEAMHGWSIRQGS